MNNGPITVAHTADNHLRASQYSHTSRSQDFLNALLSVLHDAKTLNIQHIFDAGDLFDTRTPMPAVIRQLLTIEQCLHANNQYLYVITGNHDMGSPSWTEVIHEALAFYGGKPRIVSIDHKTVTLPNGMTVVGLPSCSDTALRQVLAAHAGADVLVWHGMVRGLAEFDSEAPTVEEFAASKFRNVFLGDIHKHQYLALPGGGVIGYPGSTEITSANDNAADRGYAAIRLDPNGPTTVMHRPIAARPVLALSIGSEAMMEDALRQVRETAGSTPMIFIRFLADLPNVYGRIAAQANPESIIRAAPLPRPSGATMSGSAVTSAIAKSDAPVESFIPLFIPVEMGGLHDAAVSIVSGRGASAKDIVTAYVEKRRAELTAHGAGAA